MHSKEPTLILKRASKSHLSGQWPDDDCDVFNGDRQFGRILWTHAGPENRRWFLTITARLPQSTADRGYATARGELMADFKSAWGRLWRGRDGSRRHHHLPCRRISPRVGYA